MRILLFAKGVLWNLTQLLFVDVWNRQALNEVFRCIRGWKLQLLFSAKHLYLLISGVITADFRLQCSNAVLLKSYCIRHKCSVLKKAEQLANVCGLSSKMECRISNGFSAYSAGETDKAVILGMGGEVIRSILSRSDSFARSLERIVMQPMRGEAELRSYLYSNNYRIIDETVVFDSGRYYQLISAKTERRANFPTALKKVFSIRCRSI